MPARRPPLAAGARPSIATRPLGPSPIATEEIAAALAGYLVGAIPFALVVTRLRGIDLRKFGTGNPGASNAFRNAGKLIGVLILVLDVLKVLGPFLVLALAMDRLSLAAIWGAACQIGHSWPVYLGFKGGKGVAVGGGMYIGYAIYLGAVGILLGILVGYGTGVANRRPGFATVALLGIGPVYTWVLGAPPEIVVGGVAVIAIVILRRLFDLPGAWQSYPHKLALIWSVVGEDMVPGATTIGRR